jgi:sulfate anion transporter 2
VQVPQGMGFAAMVGLPAYFGLYTSFFPAVVYFIFGTSRHISVGVVGVITGMVVRTVTKHLQDCVVTGALTGNDTNYCSNANSRPSWSPNNDNNATTVTQPPSVADERQQAVIGVAMAMQFTIGLIFVGMYILRLGFLGRFVSHPFNSALQTAAAILTSVSQIAPALGYRSPGFYGVWNLPNQLTLIFLNIYKTNAADAICALVTIIFVTILRDFVNVKWSKKLKHPIPAELIAMILGTIISHFAQLHERYGLVITGDTPRGFIPPQVPVLIVHLENSVQFTTRTLFRLKYDFIFDCLALAIVIYGVTITLSKTLARKHRYALDDNEELLAYGLLHFVSSFFHCFPVSQAPPRTLLMESQGAKSQLAGLVSAIFVLIVIVAIGPLFYSMPRALLAAVTFTAVAPILRNFLDLISYWKTNKWDILVWLATFISALLLDPFMAIAVGIGTNLIVMSLNAYFASGSTLCHAKDTEVFVEKAAYHNVISFKGIRIFRFNGNLVFVNVDSFKRQLYKHTVHPHHVRRLREKMAGKFPVPSDKEDSETEDDRMAEYDTNNEPRDSEIEQAAETAFGRTPTIFSADSSNGIQPYNVATLRSKTNGTASNSNGIHSQTDDDGILSVPYVRAVILDCSGMTYVDYNGILCLQQLLDDYKAANVRLLLASCSAPFLATFPTAPHQDAFFPSVYDALLSVGELSSANINGIVTKL